MLSAVVVAVVGLLDLAFVSLQAWRDSGVPGWYREQLGLDYEGLSGLPENWVYNTGDEDNPIRRLVSTFLSPLASAYALVVALIYVVEPPAPLVVGPARRAAVRRAPLHAHARGASPRSRSGSSCSRSRSGGSLPAALAAGSGRRRARSSSPRTRRSGRRRATRRTSSSGCARTRARRAGTSGDRVPRRRTRRRRATGATCGTACASFSSTRRATGSAMPASSRSGPASRSRRASRRTRSSASTRALPASLAFVLWSLALLVGLWRREAWLVAAFADGARPRAADRRDRHPLARIHGVGAAGLALDPLAAERAGRDATVAG